MSKMHTGLTDYDICGEEIGELLNDAHVTDKKFNVFIPKLMPLITKSGNAVNKIFNKNIFVNDSSCSVSPSNKVVTRGYLKIGRHDSCYLTNDNNIVNKGCIVKIQIMGGNIDNMLIMDNGGMN